jgi:acyl dehydratase
VALVELEEGTRIVSNLRDIDPDDVTIGMPGPGVRRALRQRRVAPPVPPTGRVVTTTRTLDWSAIRVGDPIAPMTIDVTATVVVAGAIASRDFMPVHHDRDYAASQGSPNIFMNIITDNGLCSRFLTDWAGPEAMVRKIAIRLGVPAYAGSRLEFRGTVTGKSVLDGEGVVEVEFRAVNDQGGHVSGTAAIGLPIAKARS